MPRPITPSPAPLLALLLFACLWLPPVAAGAEPETLTVALTGGDELSVLRYRAAGGGAKRLLLWLPSEYGLPPRQRAMAADLADHGFEVWLPELHTSLFLLPGRGSLRTVDPTVVAELLGEAARRHPGNLYLMAAGGTAPLALAAVRDWQGGGYPTGRLAGAFLLHPKLYVSTPQGGESADYLPVVRATNLPIYLFQPQLSSSLWRLDALLAALATGGSPVYSQPLAGVSDGFNTRHDFTPEEERVSGQLPALLGRAARLLDHHGGTPETAAPLAGEAIVTPATAPRQALLRPYTANGPTPPLNLPRLAGGEPLALPAGKVVVLNFWTTWCPPCVEEIPSLNRLYRRLEGEGLAVIGVDVGQDAATVNAFLDKMAVAFPILLDERGEALKAWDVYAFPTTFILDRQGRIRYAVFGAFDWSSPEVVATLERLLAE